MILTNIGYLCDIMQYMQPHSMAALKVAHSIWFSTEHEHLKSGLIGVEYRNRRTGIFVTKYYKFEVNSSSTTEVKVSLQHSQGGSSCTIEAIRNSEAEGAKVILRHSEHHAHGLVEELHMYKKNLSGNHRNSLLYKNYKADSSYSEKMVMYSDVKSGSDDSFKEIKYEVELKSAIVKD